MGKAWPVPYLLDPAHFAVDAFVAFCVAVLLAVLVSAEAQAFMATLLGDSRVEAKDPVPLHRFFSSGYSRDHQLFGGWVRLGQTYRDRSK